MTRIYVSIEIAAEPSLVWSIVEPVERHIDWMADAATITFRTPQTRGIGTEFDCLTKIGPIALTDRMRITEWEPERVMGVHHTGLVTGEGRFTLERSLNGGTLFAWEEDLRFPWWLGSRLGELIGARLVLGPLWRKNLVALKQQIEQRTRAHAG